MNNKVISKSTAKFQCSSALTNLRYNCAVSLPPTYVVRREGNVLTCVCLSVYRGGVRSSWRRGGSGPAARMGGSGPAGGGQVQLPGGSGPAAGGGVRSSCQGGVRSSRGEGGSVRLGGSASCALLRAVCLLRSRRRTFLFKKAMYWLFLYTSKYHNSKS